MERHEAEAILDGDRETAVALLLRVGELIEANERLEARVAELERRLRRSSRNSSLPPSQDPPSAPPRPRGQGSGRTRGGQPGHEGSCRRLLPPERVDAVVEHWPRRCCTCAHVFDRQELVDPAEPRRHQVAELPPIAVRVTEHRLHAVRCPGCASRTRAELPRELPRSAFGPRLQAAVVTLAVRNRVLRRDTTELARELFGVELATVSRRDRAPGRGDARRAAHAARAAAQEGAGRQHRRDRLEDRRRQTDAVGRPERPERGLPDRGRPPRLRGEDAARGALPRHRLLRPLARLRLPRPQQAAALLGAPAQRLHRPRRRHGRAEDVRRGRPPDRARPLRRLARLPARRRPRPSPAPDRALQAKLRALLEHAARKSTKTRYHRLFAKGLLKRWPALWTFTHTDGVEPTNNHVERGLRGAVIYRKLSHGSQSEHGERTIERLLSASITCRLQRRSLFAYLTDVLDANIRDDPIPALA